MKYVGNYGWWITPELMNLLDAAKGGVIYVNKQCEKSYAGHPTLNHYFEWSEPWYSHREDWFQYLNQDSPEFENFKLQLPEFSKSRPRLYWWIIKNTPGQIQPMHIDPVNTGMFGDGTRGIECTWGNLNPVRYTMFLKDYEPGHILIVKDKMVDGYKAGDLFEWDDAAAEHGIANISYSIRYSLNILFTDYLT